MVKGHFGLREELKQQEEYRGERRIPDNPGSSPGPTQSEKR